MQSRLRWLFFFITMLSLVLMSSRVPLDTDMWWHIKAGEMTIQSGSPLLTDTFSYTRNGADWVNHSWLAQVVLAFLYQKMGYYGLDIFVITLSVATFALLYFLLNCHAFVKSLLIILGATLVSTVWSPRPQLFTLFFLSLLVFLVSRYYEGKLKNLWFLPVLFLLWGNFHGGYFTGILYLVMMLAGYAYDRIISNDVLPGETQATKHLLIMILASIPALLINPNGFKTLTIPFSTVGVDILRNFIDEWSSPDFHEPLQMGFVIVILLIVFLLSAVKEKYPARVIFPLLGFGLLAFYAKRNIAPFVIIMLPVFADLLLKWLETLRFSPLLADFQIPSAYSLKVKDENPLLMRMINLFLILLLGFIAAGKFVYVSYPMVVQSYLAQSIPVSAYEIYAGLDVQGNLLNEYGWGGYQILHYDDIPDFVDGRTDLFGDEIIGEWISLMRADERYERLIEKYDISAVLLHNDRLLVSALVEKGWETVYQDSIAALLVKPE